MASDTLMMGVLASIVSIFDINRYLLMALIRNISEKIDVNEFNIINTIKLYII